MSLSKDNEWQADLTLVRGILSSLTPLPDAEWRFLREHLKPLSLTAGERLTQAGDVADRLAFVCHGLVRKVCVTARGQEVVRGFGPRGSLVGAYASLLTGAPANLSVEALVDSKLVVLDWRLVNALYARHTCWQIVGRRIAEQQLLEREARAHELLTATARQRFLAFVESHREILPLLRSRDIASYLGITPVSLSRLRAELRKRAQ